MTPAPGRLIVDAHLDLGFCALQMNRDLTQPAAKVRTHDSVGTLESYGSCTVTLPELRRGRVGIVCATVMSRLDPGDRWTRTGMYTQDQCYATGRGHLAYYEALERRGHVRLLRTRKALDQVSDQWLRDEAEAGPGAPPVGLVLSMESADPILDPDQVFQWHEWGLRMVGLSHYGVSTYSHGTATDGGLLPPARPLLRALADCGIAVDVTHLTDRAHWELLEAYEGPVCASHHNCRALTPGQRQLSDDMIRSVAARNGVIGVAMDAWMLDPDWQKGRPASQQRTSATLSTVADHIDHICQTVGEVGTAGIGSDLDGGFGCEQSPRDLNTIADLQALAPLLRDRGYSGGDIHAVLAGNWLRLLGQAMPTG